LYTYNKDLNNNNYNGVERVTVQNISFTLNLIKTKIVYVLDTVLPWAIQILYYNVYDVVNQNYFISK
jgi:hypothetical protein